MKYQHIASPSIPSESIYRAQCADRRRRLLSPVNAYSSGAEKSTYTRPLVQEDAHVADRKAYFRDLCGNKAKMYIRKRCGEIGYCVEDILGKSREKKLCHARQTLMWEVDNIFGKSYPEVGRLFGGRDHTTALHAIQKIQAEINARPPE